MSDENALFKSVAEKYFRSRGGVSLFNNTNKVLLNQRVIQAQAVPTFLKSSGKATFIGAATMSTLCLVLGATGIGKVVLKIGKE